MAGTALALGFYFTSCQEEVEPDGVIELFKLNVDDVANGAALNPFVMIDKEGMVTIMAHRPDMGQGTFQAVPLLIAEELDIDFSKITIKQAPGDPKYDQQGVGGSSSMRTMYEPMRKIGATAREMLVQAAAKRWNVSPSDCQTAVGVVTNTATKETVSYGDLVEEASAMEVPTEIQLKDPKDFKLIGKSVPRPSINHKVKGTANFGMDMKKEGMVYAMIERSPNFEGEAKSIDDSAALAVKGVLQVVETKRPLFKKDIPGVAVIAENYWAALQGRKALKVEWEDSEKLWNTDDMFDTLREAGKTEGIRSHQEGNFAKNFKAQEKQLSADYETPFLAHAAMEPQNVLVEVTETSCEIWAPTQFPQWARQAVAELLKFEADQIKVHVSFLGGGFGRRALPDFILEGVVLSKELKKPVKVVWSREDDMTQSPMRPGSVNRLTGAVDAEGKLVALQHKVVTPSISHSLFGAHDPKKVPGGIMEPIGEPLYDLPNYESRYVFVDADPLPLVWWRSVYSSTNVFGHECFIDELAEAAQKDPVDFRLGMLDHNPRYKALLELLRKKSGWDRQLPEGWARGVAMTHCFDSTCGHVVEVSRGSDGKANIERVITVIDCGVAINPDNVRAQTEGNIVMGLTAALKDPITFKDSRIVENNYHNYRMLRINEMPKVEVHIVPSGEAPTGVGEPALPPIAPALCNALYQLTGKRIRKLPFDIGAV